MLWLRLAVSRLETWDNDARKITPIGGSDHLSKWILEESKIDDKEIRALAQEKPNLLWYFLGKSDHVRSYNRATCQAE